MIQTHLILIDGIAGTGKTTLSLKLYRIINNLRGNALLYPEFKKPHPIHEWAVDDYQLWLPKVLGNWQKLGHELGQTSSLGIVESSLFQGTVGDLLERDVAEELIVNYACQVPSLIQAASPVLIYLVPDSVSSHIERTYAQRTGLWQTKIDQFIQQTAFGETRNLAGLAGYITFIKQLKRLSDFLYHRYDMQKLRLNISQDTWDNYETHIFDFLEIPKQESQGKR